MAGFRLGRRKKAYPSKTEINLLQKEITSSSPSRIIPMAIFLCLLVYVIFRFGVAEGIYRNYKLDSDIKKLEMQLSRVKEHTEDYVAAMEEYSRYNYDKYTPAEIVLYDRTEMVDLVGDLLMPAGVCEYYRIEGNVLSVRIRDMGLSETSALIESLYKVPSVKDVYVMTAVSDKDERAGVDMSITFKDGTDEYGAEESPEVPL